MEQHVFHAMGTDVELLLDTPPSAESREAFATIESEFERLEAILSRFRPESELSALNREGMLDVSLELQHVLELALEARERTRGRFDPTVHDALVAAGYDRSFELVAPDADSNGSAALARCGGGVSLDAAIGRVALEPGFHLDFGGIGKGYAVDQAVQLLALAGPCLVSAGGDLAVRGNRTWPVGVEDGPTLGLDRGAIATSGRDRRRWRRGGEELHHLIDPSTGRPAASDLLRVTVVAGSAVEAEVLAKSLFIGGEREALEAGVPAVLLTADGRTLLTGGIA
ncbi:MAG: FAD:protein FMN transferase [Gaiellaceae bacterium]